MKKTIKILVLKNEIEAKLLDEILTEKGIPHMIRSYHDSVYDGLWQTSSCWGQLDALEKDREEILKVYQEMLQQDNETGN
jgi:hypothetical protein